MKSGIVFIILATNKLCSIYFLILFSCICNTLLTCCLYIYCSCVTAILVFGLIALNKKKYNKKRFKKNIYIYIINVNIHQHSHLYLLMNILNFDKNTFKNRFNLLLYYVFIFYGYYLHTQQSLICVSDRT